MLVLGATLMLAACGPRFDANADVRDSKVTVHVRKLKAGDEVSIKGIEGATATAKFSSATIDIPAEKVGEGQQELTVVVTRGSKTKSKKVNVTVPAAALAPFLTITGCEGFTKGNYGAGAVKMKSKGMPSYTKEQRCALQPSGAIALKLKANADAEVKVGDTKAQMGDGVGIDLLPITPVLHKLSLRGVGDSKASGEFPYSVQATSSRGGKTVTYPVDLTIELKAIRSALFDAVLETDGGKAARWPRTAHDGKPRGVAFAAKRHPVRVDGQDQTILNSSYAQVLVAGGEHKADEVDLFAVASPSDVTKRGACTGYRTISGVGGVRNTGFVMGFDVKVYDHTGKEVASKVFSKPKKTRCPSTLSGTRGKTTILVWAPNKADVEQWLESLVK